MEIVMKNFLKNEWLIIFVLIFPFMVIFYFWNELPEQIPIHWNYAGEIDNYVTKIPGIFILPAFAVVLYILFLAIPRIDPRWDSYKLFKGSYQTLKFSIVALMTLLFYVIIAASLGFDFDIMYFVIVPIVLLFTVVGNMLGKIRPNWFVGIRLPWTLSNDQVWQLTHRFAGKLWVWSSLCMMVLILILPTESIKIIFWIYFAFITIIPVVYSYLIYKNLSKNKEEIV